MKFTGTLIEDLMATVERAEKRTRPDQPLFGGRTLEENMFVEPWFASVQENAEYDPKVLGVS